MACEPESVAIVAHSAGGGVTVELVCLKIKTFYEITISNDVMKIL